LNGLLAVAVDVAAIAVAALLIFGPHEAGHLLVGLAFGAQALDFSVGIGPKVVSRTWGGTLYAIRWFPVAAYVRFEDDYDERVSPGRRLVISAAGPTASFVAGYVYFAAGASLYVHDLWRGFFGTARAAWFAITFLFGHPGLLFSPEGLSGPVGVGQLVTQSTAYGLYAWLLVVAIISVSTGLLNLLPILPLDGGVILAAFFQLVARRRLTRWITAYTAVGYVVVIGLVLYATRSDLLRLLGR